MASLYQSHRAKWLHCTRCELSKQRNRVVLARGKVPVPIVFIGEAPGASEDVTGMPFDGPAGRLLDSIIKSSINGQYDYAITNLVACIPKNESGTKDATMLQSSKRKGSVVEPPPEAIKACAERLREFIAICKPRIVVCVGSIAAKWVQSSLGCKPAAYHWVEIIHPAAILRMDISQQGLAVQRCVVAVEEALEVLA